MASNIYGTSTEGNVAIRANPITGALLTEGPASGSGSSDTTEATQLLVKTAVEAINTKTGEVQASPTANTILGRLKDLLTGIVLAAGENTIGKVVGGLTIVSTEFIRPSDTTAYTAGDVVSNSTGATTVITLANLMRVNNGTGYIVGIKLTTDKKSITPRFRVHFFNATDATLAVDNVAHKELYTEIAKRISYYDLPAMSTAVDTTNSTMSRSIDMTMRLPVQSGAATRDVYAVLEALDAFTPASAEKFTLTVMVDNN